MRYWYKIDVDLGCVFAKRSGPYEHAGWMATYEAIDNDPALQYGMNRIYDYRDAEGAPSKSETLSYVRYFNDLDKKLGPRKVASVVPELHSFGMSRMYGILRSDTAAEVCQFRTLEEAMVWLDLPPGFADPFPSLEEMNAAE